MRGHLNDLDWIQCSKRVRIATRLLQGRQQAVELVRLPGTKADARSFTSTSTSLHRGTEASDIHSCAGDRNQKHSILCRCKDTRQTIQPTTLSLVGCVYAYAHKVCTYPSRLVWYDANAVPTTNVRSKRPPLGAGAFPKKPKFVSDHCWANLEVREAPWEWRGPFLSHSFLAGIYY
jgi:hypothetical protein